MVANGSGIQIDKGSYTRIHNAILEKLVQYDFTSREYACLLYLLRMTYGFNRKEVKLSNSDIGKAAGLDPSNVSRAMRSLVTNKVVIRSETGPNTAPTWKFNKYFEQWTVTSRVKTAIDDSANYCQNDNSLEGDSCQNDNTTIAEMTIEVLPKQQENYCQNDNSYISAKDSIKDKRNGKDSPPAPPPGEPQKAQTAAPNTNGDYFGMKRPIRRERVIADGYTQDAAKEGVDAPTFVAIFNALIDAAGWRDLVDAGSDKELNWSKESALTLIRLGNKTPEDIERLADAYMKANTWRTAPPKPKDIAEYASQVKAGVLREAKPTKFESQREIVQVKFTKPGDDIYA